MQKREPHMRVPTMCRVQQRMTALRLLQGGKSQQELRRQVRSNLGRMGSMCQQLGSSQGRTGSICVRSGKQLGSSQGRTGSTSMPLDK